MKEKPEVTRSGQVAAVFAGVVCLFLGLRAIVESFQVGAPIFRLKIRSIVEGPLAVGVTVTVLAIGLYLVVSGYKGMQRSRNEA